MTYMGVIITLSFIFPLLCLIWNYLRTGYWHGLIGQFLNSPSVFLPLMVLMTCHIALLQSQLYLHLVEKPPAPWWSVDCAVAVRALKRTMYQLRHTPPWKIPLTTRKLRSRARQVIRNSNMSSLRAYVSSLSDLTSSMLVWLKSNERGPPALSLA
mgnify:CR=1 FL=1